MATRVFNYAGQSNMVGLRAFLDYLPSFGLGGEISYIRDGARTALGPNLAPDPEGNDGFRGGGFVPSGYASFGYCVEVFLSHIFDTAAQDVVALKSAQANTSLAVHWNSDAAGSNWRQFANNTRAGQDYAAAHDDDVTLGPLIWWQGETDASRLDYARAYEDNLREFIDDYRALVGDEHARVVLVRTISGGGSEGLSLVQGAQRAIALADPDVVLYDPSRLARYSDGLHFTRDYAVEAAADIANLLVSAGWERTEHRWGTGGGDVVDGTSASQRLWGLAGDDTLNGGSGNDTLAGDLGADRLNGGDGTGDTAVYDAATGGVTINLSTGTGQRNIAAGDTLTGIESLQGGAYADSLTGGANANRLMGGGGQDTLSGGAGWDVLAGGSGADRMTGGTGRDVYDFDRASESPLGAPDVLLGFDAPGTMAGDRVDLAGVDADTTRSGNQTFVFGSAGRGGLTIGEQGTDTVVQGNLDGDADFEFAFLIRDGATRASFYAADDFIL